MFRGGGRPGFESRMGRKNYTNPDLNGDDLQKVGLAMQQSLSLVKQLLVEA